MPATRESPSAVILRCLALLRRLQRGPTSKAELIEAVRKEEGSEAYGGATGRSLDKRFDADKRKLRDLFGLQLRYSRASDTYEIIDNWLPLLDLPDETLGVIAFLQETFEPGTPNHDAVQSFLSTLVSYLSPERRGFLERQRTALDVEWGQRDDDVIDPAVEHKLHKALVERRLIAFDYYSPAQPDQQPRRHLVEPWGRYFDSSRGHYYLRGYCRELREPDGSLTHPCYYIHYRLGRIDNMAVLPDKLPPQPPRAPHKPLIYRLSSKIARRGEVTRHPGITILAVEQQPDGSVMVHAETDNVWWAVRTLLHYGVTCQVLGGPEALAEIRQIVKEMAEIYGLVE